MKRFLVIWFPQLLADWVAIRKPDLQGRAFVLSAPVHGRKVVTAASMTAIKLGIVPGISVADARALAHDLEVLDDRPGRSERLLEKLARWCIRFSPDVAVNLPDGLIIDATKCAHLWGGEAPYINHISEKLQSYGYHVRLSMADTVGAAWAVARYTKTIVVQTGQHSTAIIPLPPAALRLPPQTVARLESLGLTQINSFAAIPRNALRRRFGELLLARLDQALGVVPEPITGIQVPEPFDERLACLEPIVTRKGIEIALERLLAPLCIRLQKEGKGLRIAVLQLWRLDGSTQQVRIGTNRPSCNAIHLHKLFEERISNISPGSGIEVFSLTATQVEDSVAAQEKFWSATTLLESQPLAELVDRVTNRLGNAVMHRYLPQAHYWPERSLKATTSLIEPSTTEWRLEIPRPIQLLHTPVLIQVMAPIPDDPPISFTHNGEVHRVKRADGPERVEREWWIDHGQHRDYYLVEDTEGRRYWVFRSGHYDAEKTYRWYLHGYFP